MAPTSLAGASHRQNLQERPDRLERVLQPDLLALLVGAAVVRDRHFVDARAHPRDLAGDLGLDAEVARLQIESIGDVADEHLVAGLHVREVQVGERIGQERQHPVADRMPEIEDAMAARRPEKARAVDHVGLALENRLEQQRVLARVVFEIGVLDDHAHRRSTRGGRAPPPRPCPGSAPAAARERRCGRPSRRGCPASHPSSHRRR